MMMALQNRLRKSECSLRHTPCDIPILPEIHLFPTLNHDQMPLRLESGNRDREYILNNKRWRQLRQLLVRINAFHGSEPASTFDGKMPCQFDKVRQVRKSA